MRSEVGVFFVCTFVIIQLNSEIIVIQGVFIRERVTIFICLIKKVARE